MLTIKLGIANTSNQDFEIRAMAGELYTNETFIGVVTNFSPIVIYPRSETVANLKIRLSIIGLVSQLVDGIKSGTWKQALELDLSTNVDNIVTETTIKYKV